MNGRQDWEYARDIGLPFTLELVSGPPLVCREILRCLPGRRLVCRAEQGGNTLLVKLFMGQDADREAAEDAAGVKALMAAGIPTPALLSHTELTTLFHEFGHGLHHMLTRQTVAAVSGINGVAWDAVELPSQFLENWCWERESLALISGHYQTGEALPVELLDRLLAARNFQSAMVMARQLEFALFDWRLHREWGTADLTSVQELMDEVRREVAVAVPPPFNRFQHSFSHIFAGGYAAGYYSYKWAEVLSADAFSLFEEEGIFNREAGSAFRTHILEAGGSSEPMELFVAFRGREPKIEPLLRHCGIAPG